MPLSICIDCCVLLNQCSDFYEKTNQAQTSLRQLLIINPKSEPHSGEPNVEYIDKTVEFLKEENSQVIEGIVECNLSNANYISNSVSVDNNIDISNSVDITTSVEISDTVEINDTFFVDESTGVKCMSYSTIEDIQEEGKNKKCKTVVKKNPPKQPKKKVRKRSQTQKMEDLELGLTSDLDEELNELDPKSNTKIPDNYMTG